MNIYIEETKHLNYKKVILVIVIIILCITCVYIGIILPQKVKQEKENNEKQEQIQISESKREENNNIIETVFENEIEIPSREEDKPYPIITPDGIEKIKGIYHSDYKRVFLTFDDGPSKTVTPEILRILDEYDVKATFFVLGSRVELYPNIVKEAYEKGHYIANHGYSHKYSYIYESVDNVLNEYRNTENIIRNSLGKADYYSNVFRFPGGLPRRKICRFESRSGQNTRSK